MVAVFYRPEQTAQVQSFSPSPRKPALVVDEWSRKFKDGVSFHSFDPVTEKQIAAVHDPAFVRGVLNCTRANGFGGKDKAVSDSLPYTSGSMLAAAKHALQHGVAVSPTSGFHHATYGGAGGFCTFNGLMVTAVALLNQGLANRVGILDLDMHYGNGTDDIIVKLGLRKTDQVIHYSGGAEYDQPEQAADFFERLPKIVNAMSDCDIILYQAGADPNIDDPLGGWLSTPDMKFRDRIVLEGCKAMDVPVAWNLAGGYQNDFQKILDIHNNTMEVCINTFSKEAVNV